MHAPSPCRGSHLHPAPQAINFDYFEDSHAGLFQRRDPREGSASLDIERGMSRGAPDAPARPVNRESHVGTALDKLEKVALRVARRRGRPLVLCFNNAHLFPQDETGRNLLWQLQHRAELWAKSGPSAAFLLAHAPVDGRRLGDSRLFVVRPSNHPTHTLTAPAGMISGCTSSCARWRTG